MRHSKGTTTVNAPARVQRRQRQRASARGAATLALAAWMAGVAALPRAGIACGPNFPNSILNGEDSALLYAPSINWLTALAPMLPEPDPRLKAVLPDGVSVYKQSEDVESAELGALLPAAGVTRAEMLRVIDTFAAARRALRAVVELEEKGLSPEQAAAMPRRPLVAMPELGPRVPEEIRLYLQGRVHYANGDLPAARKAWATLIELPAAQRRARTVWAHYMLGRSHVDDDAPAASRHFGACRDAAFSGLPDPLGLATASLGWEALAQHRAGNDRAAVELYLRQLAAGDRSAAWSLQRIARAIAEQDQPEAARDPVVARLITTWFVARGGPFDGSATIERATRWLSAVDLAQAKIDDADRMALAAYQANQIDVARRWAAIAPENSPLALWVRARIELNSGEYARAVDLLARASEAFPPEEAWENDPGAPFPGTAGNATVPAERTSAERGVLLLARGQYIDALTHLLRSDYWVDAAYVADRVLTLAELTALVDRLTATPDARIKAETVARLRDLLARRLARSGQWEAALPYYRIDQTRDAARQYMRAMAAAKEKGATKSTRAASLWAAARIMRHSGMELTGTELAPDWHYYHGAFSPPDPSRAGEIAPASEDERRRRQTTQPSPYERFHYRFVAADLAWDAAALMPDGDAATAAVLCEAGRWLAAQSPEKADRFYKALVRRCGRTPLGQEAARLKWFPK